MCDTSTMEFRYPKFKQEHVFSLYVLMVKSRHFRNILNRFRRLEISQGRYSNTLQDMRRFPTCTRIVESEKILFRMSDLQRSPTQNQ